MTAELNTWIQRYIDAWNALDVEGLAAHWAADDTDIYYLAEEIDGPLTSFVAITDYWRRTARLLDWVRIDIDELSARELGDDYLLLRYAMHVDARAATDGYASAPIGIDVRVSAVLRRTDAGWRFIHYAEAAPGALPQLRRFYAANVRDA